MSANFGEGEGEGEGISCRVVLFPMRAPRHCAVTINIIVVFLRCLHTHGGVSSSVDSPSETWQWDFRVAACLLAAAELESNALLRRLRARA
jgi:hypothetical protein